MNSLIHAGTLPNQSRVETAELGDERHKPGNQHNCVDASLDSTHLQEVMRAAHSELGELIRRRADIMKRIGNVKQVILGLAHMFGDELLNDDLLNLVGHKGSGRQVGFTRACRLVLMEAAHPLTAREVCKEIEGRFATVLLNHKDPLASVTTVLKRLVDYKEASSSLGESGKRVWEWTA
jgi:hypothetical protein